MEQKPRIEKIAKWATIGWVAAMVCWFVVNMMVDPIELELSAPGVEKSLSYNTLYSSYGPFFNTITSFVFYIGFLVAAISWISVSIMDFMKHTIRKKVLVLAIFHLLIILFFALLFFDLL